MIGDIAGVRQLQYTYRARFGVKLTSAAKFGPDPLTDFDVTRRQIGGHRAAPDMEI